MRNNRFKKSLALLLCSCLPLMGFKLPSPNLPIKHIVLIVFENTSYNTVLKQPFFTKLTRQGALISEYFAVTHPSQPNYLTLIGGSTFDVQDDENVDLSGQQLGDLLDAKGKSWKSYAEGYPGHCFLGARKGSYYRKHEPFLSFKSVQTHPATCAKIVEAAQFFKDLKTQQLPDFSLYIPDINNDGHDTGIAFANNYFFNTFGPIFANPEVLKDTLFIITFDEDDYISKNHIYTLFLGAGVKPGITVTARYNHYSLLSTIEMLLGLDSLDRHDKSAAPIKDIWL